MSIVAGGNKGRRPYPPRFKREAVELYRRSGNSIVHVATEISVAPESLRKWNLQHEVDVGEREGLTSDDRARLKELERENQRLRMERDFSSERPWPACRPPAADEIGRFAGASSRRAPPRIGAGEPVSELGAGVCRNTGLAPRARTSDSI